VPKPTRPAYYTIPQLVQMIRLRRPKFGHKTINRWVIEGRIRVERDPEYKRGAGRYLIPKKEVKRILQRAGLIKKRYSVRQAYFVLKQKGLTIEEKRIARLVNRGKIEGRRVRRGTREFYNITEKGLNQLEEIIKEEKNLAERTKKSKITIFTFLVKQRKLARENYIKTGDSNHLTMARGVSRIIKQKLHRASPKLRITYREILSEHG